MKLRKNLIAFLAMPLLVAGLSSCNGSGYSIEEVDNAGGSVFYEIFVGSFCDSNGDGVGDLNGIKSKLPYLKKLGVSGLWLTPIHPSSSYHHYDVKDYYAVSNDFGTLDDFTSLCTAAKAQGIDIILDMVFNHCSVNSQWYANWLANISNEDSPYYNNFSYFEEDRSGTFYESALGGYVEANFDNSMPEFNFDTPYVLEELKRIQDFWLDKGASGFRYDAVKYYYCTNNNGTITGNTAKNVEVLTELANSARAKKADAYLIGECWVDSVAEIYNYTNSGMNMFHFPTSGVSAVNSVGTMPMKTFANFMNSVAEANEMRQEHNPNGDIAIFVSNHDQDRWGAYYEGHDNAEEARKLMASAYLLTPGTPFMYYGEEIEMLGSRKSSDKTDAMRRQAMVWGDESITCKQPENFIYTPQTETSVAKAESDGYSLLNHYRKVISIRNKYKDAFRKGNYEVLEFGKNRVTGFKITYNNDTYYLIHNCYNSEAEVTLPGGTTLLEDIPSMKTEAKLNSGKLTLAGYSSALIK